jgi:hypothetical protein
VIDENYINYIFLDYFVGTDEVSLLEKLIAYWPEGLYGGTLAIRGLMNAGVWATLFEDLRKYSPETQVDFRCGFNKRYLKEGGLS